MERSKVCRAGAVGLVLLPLLGWLLGGESAAFTPTSGRRPLKARAAAQVVLPLQATAGVARVIEPSAVPHETSELRLDSTSERAVRLWPEAAAERVRLTGRIRSRVPLAEVAAWRFTPATPKPGLLSVSRTRAVVQPDGAGGSFELALPVDQHQTVLVLGREAGPEGAPTDSWYVAQLRLTPAGLRGLAQAGKPQLEHAFVLGPGPVWELDVVREDARTGSLREVAPVDGLGVDLYLYNLEQAAQPLHCLRLHLRPGSGRVRLTGLAEATRLVVSAADCAPHLVGGDGSITDRLAAGRYAVALQRTQSVEPAASLVASWPRQHAEERPPRAYVFSGQSARVARLTPAGLSWDLRHQTRAGPLHVLLVAEGRVGVVDMTAHAGTNLLAEPAWQPLEPLAGTLEGAGEPLEGRRVAWTHQGLVLDVARTDAEGRFALSGVPLPATLRVEGLGGEREVVVRQRTVRLRF